MLEREFRELLEMLHARLRAIQETLREKISADGEAAQASQQTSDEIRRDGVWRGVAERDIQKHSNRQSETHARKNYGQQVVLNVLTFLAVAGAWFYGFIAAYQAYEMRLTTQAAQDSSDIARQTLNESAWQFRQTFKQMEAQTKSAREAADAANSAAKSAASQFESSRRPWVVLDAVISGTLGMDDPSRNYRVNLTFTASNMGPGIATRIRVESKVVVQTTQDDLQHFCETLKPASGENTPTLFPGQAPYQLETADFIMSKDILAFHDFLRKRAENESGFTATLISCVAYSSAFNPSARYYTGRSYQINYVSGGYFIGTKTDEPLKLTPVVGEGFVTQ